MIELRFFLYYSSFKFAEDWTPTSIHLCTTPRLQSVPCGIENKQIPNRLEKERASSSLSHWLWTHCDKSNLRERTKNANRDKLETTHLLITTIATVDFFFYVSILLVSIADSSWMIFFRVFMWVCVRVFVWVCACVCVRFLERKIHSTKISWPTIYHVIYSYDNKTEMKRLLTSTSILSFILEHWPLYHRGNRFNVQNV